MTGLAKSRDLQANVRKCPEMSATGPSGGRRAVGTDGKSPVATGDSRFPRTSADILSTVSAYSVAPLLGGAGEHWNPGRRSVALAGDRWQPVGGCGIRLSSRRRRLGGGGSFAAAGVVG
ncbi:MAG: hypothetical protein QOF83_4316 [Solirubrobacteraceae bacterium]|jgi:hypothetical protein|nr:hypothetical protein [Solirubrobacteraceae bacterium]